MLELDQVQSNVLREYQLGSAPACVQFLFLRFTDGQAARALIGRVLPLVTSCATLDGRPPATGSALNLGLAYPALDLLGLGGTVRPLDESDNEATGAIAAFKCGMEERAKEILGDRGASDPSRWDPVYRDRKIHAVLCLSGHTKAEIDALRANVDTIVKGLLSAGVSQIHEEHGQHFGPEHAGKEHFGFVDGIAQPDVLGAELPSYPGAGTPSKRDWLPVQTGEFVLGHLDESARVQFASPLFKNGSFMVLRKLEQHVARFREYVEEVGQRRGVEPELVAAKMVGRWPSGAPLVLAPKADNPKLGANPERNNNFRYAQDRDGERCPFGAHIRRNNPREDPSGPGVVQTRLHRIIRRAIPYGPWLPTGQPDDGVERGSLFVVINADISRQFEFVQQNWVNSVLSSTHLTMPADRDPLIGHQLDGDEAGKFVMPSAKRNKPPVIAWQLPNFVTTRGGAYFLLPSLDALYDIANNISWPDRSDCDSAAKPGLPRCPATAPLPIEPAPLPDSSSPPVE